MFLLQRMFYVSNADGNPMVCCLFWTFWKNEVANFDDLNTILIDISVCEQYYLCVNNLDQLDFFRKVSIFPYTAWV